MAKELWQLARDGDMESVFKADVIDLKHYQNTKDALPTLQQVEDDLLGEYCGQPVQDGFFSLMKRTVQDNPNLPARLKPLADLMKLAMEAPQYERLRERSVGKPVAAGIGAAAFMKEVFTALPDDLKETAAEHCERQTQADENEREAASKDALAEMLEEWKRLAEQERVAAQDEADAADGVDDDAWSSAREKADQAQAKAASLEQQIALAAEQAANAHTAAETAGAEAEAAYQQFADKLADRRAEMLAAANKAAGKAGEEAQQMETFIRGFSLASGGDPSRLDPETIKAAMQVWHQNQNLQQLADWLGWATNVIDSEWRASPKGSTRPVGFHNREVHPPTMTALERASSMGVLGPAMKESHLQRALEGRVKHRKFEGDRPAGKGPLFIVADQSGSTYGAVQSLIKAVEWRLLEIARRDGRDFYSIPFAGPDNHHLWTAPARSKPDPQGTAAHLLHMYGGGTEPYSPLEQALEVIAQQELKADILLLTDTSFGAVPTMFWSALQRAKAQAPVQIVTVVVGGYTNPEAEKFSDHVIHVRDLAKGKDELRAAFKRIL